AGATYNFRGGVIARNYIRILGNNARFRLKNNAVGDLLIYDTSILTLIRFDAETLILDGNKPNQTLELRGICFGFPYSESKNVQINNTTMWGYSWDEACLTKVISENFSGKAIYCAVPGDVTGLNSRAQFSKYGWYNDWEHFKLIESHEWGNEVGF